MQHAGPGEPANVPAMERAREVEEEYEVTKAAQDKLASQIDALTDLKQKIDRNR